MVNEVTVHEQWIQTKEYLWHLVWVKAKDKRFKKGYKRKYLKVEPADQVPYVKMKF